MAVPVVELARLGVGEHLVGLGHLAEARVGVGVLRDVGVQLAREPPERLLDLLLVGVARDAEQLVVVAFGRRHPPHMVPAAVAGIEKMRTLNNIDCSGSGPLATQ